jgi:hypothetical protein
MRTGIKKWKTKTYPASPTLPPVCIIIEIWREYKRDATNIKDTLIIEAKVFLRFPPLCDQ